MQVFDSSKRWVDPIALARISTRFRPMGVVVPSVVRPILLTDQLKGCSCSGCSRSGLGAYRSATPGLDGMGQLGQIDPGSLALEINTMLAAARSFWDSLVKALGIRAGAREADVITPVQDKITSTILAPAVQMGTNDQNYTCTDMRKMLGVIEQARIEFKAFLTNTQWEDGRAAQQALVWLEGPLPASTSGAWFHQVENDFSGEVTQKCGTGGSIPPGGQVTGSSALVPLLLGGALFLLRR